MNKKYLILPCMIVSVIFVATGCETVPKKFKEDLSGIKARVETLESRVEGVETKQGDIERMTGEQAQVLEKLKSERARRAKTNISIKPKVVKGKGRIKEIQTCLENAGFYKGRIDGVKGKATKQAIREFQKASGLIPDGIVGKRTWAALSTYAAGATSESLSNKEGAATK